MYAISIGAYAGQNSQQTGAISIGVDAGSDSQGTASIAIGANAGQAKQEQGSIAIGNYAGQTGQGPYSIAIGNQAGTLGLKSNSIVSNASEVPLNPITQGVFIKPITQSNNTSLGNTLAWNSTTGEIVANTSKTFVINHPNDKNKYLVHACLEGPEAGVYYRGKGQITNNISIEIELPNYVSNLATDFTIQITHIYDGQTKTYSTSEVENGVFTVYGNNGKFFWLVHGLRQSINVEPNKENVEIKGAGPYKWI
jgi:hypothetical protein